MKKMLVFLMIFGLIAGALSAPAMAKKKKKPTVPVRVERKIEIKYSGGNLGAATPAFTGGGCFPGGGAGGSGAFDCIVTPTTDQDLFVKVEITDASGQKAGGFLSQGDDNGDGLADGYGEFCGSMTDSVALTHPGVDLGISLYPGICSDASGPSIVTSGTMVLTFSNMP